MRRNKTKFGQLLLAAIPELPPENGYIRLEKAHLYALARRCTGIMLALILYIEGRTTSHADHPEYADIDMDEFEALTGASERTVAFSLARLEKLGFLQRERPAHEHHRGGYKVCPENFATPPLPQPRTRICKPRTGSVKAPSQAAALRVAGVGSAGLNLIAAQDADFSPALPFGLNLISAQPEPSPFIRFGLKLDSAHREMHPEAYTQGGQPDASREGLQGDPVRPGQQREESDSALQSLAGREGIAGNSFQPNLKQDSALAETYCPWGWSCPYLLSTQTETEYVGRSVAETPPPERPTDRQTEILRAIPQQLSEVLQDTPGPELLHRIETALEGAPARRLTERIRKRWNKLTGPEGSLGMLEHLARDVGNAWKAEQAAQPPLAPVADGSLCPRCSGSGLVGVAWETLAEAKTAVEAGAEICDCEAARLFREEFPRAAGGGE